MTTYMTRKRQLPYESSTREYAGEDIARGLVGWLNARFGKKDYERITKIITISNEIERCRLQVERRVEGFSRDHRRGKALVNALAAQLEHYEFRPCLFGQVDGGHWLLRWRMKDMKETDVGERFVPVVAYANRLEARWGEADALNALIALGQRGYVTHLRQCLCNKWFYARFAPQHCCSAKCRQKLCQQSNDYKRRRREYMRNYRRREKASYEDAKRLARRG